MRHIRKFRPHHTPPLGPSHKPEEKNNRALQLLDQLMDEPGVDIEAFKRVADICDEEEVSLRR